MRKAEKDIAFRTGTTRHVILIGRYAVKFPRLLPYTSFLYGLIANLTERKFWRQMHHPLLARVYWADPLGFILIMERADRVCSKFDSTVPAFFEKCKKEGLPVDSMPWNVGRFKGKKKLIDYGN